MNGFQPGIFASVFGVGFGIASLIGYVRRQRWKQQLQVWEEVAAERGWQFQSTPGFRYSAGTLPLKGTHAGRSLTVETEHRGTGKQFNIFTIVRHERGIGFPRELTIGPETLRGDKFLKLFGVKGEQAGNASLDAALGLHDVTPKVRAFLRHGDMQRTLLNVDHAFRTFTIKGGGLTAEVLDVPRTRAGLYALLTPVRGLADAVRSIQE
ncbi:hypothetical protein ACLEPN_24680 [Myxococcus sp. 1LA]